MRKFFLGVFFISALAGVGCVSEATRQLVNQSYQAGRSLEDDESLPTYARDKGRDIADNQVEVAQDIGSPANPVPYSTQASAQFRQEARTTRENRANFFSGIVGAVTSNIPWATTILGFAGAAFAWWKKGKGDVLLKEATTLFESTVDGIERVKSVLKPEEVEGMNMLLRNAAKDHKIYDTQKEKVATIKARKKS